MSCVYIRDTLIGMIKCLDNGIHTHQLESISRFSVLWEVM